MSSPLPVVTTGPGAEQAPRSRWALFLRALSPRTIGLTLVFSLLVAVVLNPIFELQFSVLLRLPGAGSATPVACGPSAS